MENLENIGIVGTGIYLPKHTMSAQEISEKTNGAWTAQDIVDKLGFKQIYIAGDNEGAQEMSYLAAMDCLQNTGVDPLEIDVILGITAEWKEYPLTTSALYVQGKIGANNAWGLDLQSRCSSCVLAIKMAKDMMLADDDISTIMIVGGYRNGDFVNFADNNLSMMYDLSAGGGALIMRKGHNENLVLGSHIISDGSLSRTVGVQIGGSACPISQENISYAYKSLKIINTNIEKERLNATFVDNWLVCIHNALRKSNLKSEELDFLNVLHIKRSAHLELLAELGLSEEDSFYLEDYGHLGQLDQILVMHLARKRNFIKKGDNICLMAAGIGYTWAASIVRWG